MRHLTPMVLAQIRAMMPVDSHFVLMIATKDGVGIDTSIQDPRVAKMFILETAHEMNPKEAVCLHDTNGDGDCHLCVRDKAQCPIKKGAAEEIRALGRTGELPGA